MTRNARRSGPALRVPDALLDALALLEGGALDAGPQVRRIAAGVLRLNAGLTRERTGFLGYLRDPELRAAYRSYYLCANAPKLFPVLDGLSARGLLPREGGRALELGCGPGTGVVALSLWAALRGERWTCHATDLLPEAIASAAELMGALGEPLTTSLVDLRRPLSLVGAFHLILCLNVINELDSGHDAARLVALRALLAPGGVLIVLEPASRPESRRALSFRDAAVSSGWQVLGPCTHSLACPALALADGWCHGEWRFERPPFMRAVDQLTGLRREVLKATWFALTPATSLVGDAEAAEPVDGEGLRARVMGARLDAKGRSEVEVCVAGELRRVELQTRDRNPSNADFFDLTRHDLVQMAGPGVSAGTRRLGSADAVARIDEDRD